MQIEALKIFCDVVRLGSFSRGAKLNNVLQPTASQTVQHLEEHLGVTLIDRSHRPWKLTPQGKTFYEGCREVLERYFALEAEAKRTHEETSSVVRVAAIYSVGLRHMNSYIQKFSQLNHGAHVEMEYLHPDQVYERVLDDRADLGIVSFPHARREVSVIPWRDEVMVVACHPKHRLAREKKISVQQVAGEKFVGFDKALDIRREIDRFLKRHGVEPDVIHEFDNIEAIKRAVEAASGIAILPRPTLDWEVRSGTLAAVPFHKEQLVRPLGIIHRRGKKLYPPMQQFIDLLQNGEPEEHEMMTGNGRRARRAQR